MATVMRMVGTAVLGVFLLAGLVGCGGGEGDNENAMTEEKWNAQVHVGMTEAEINAALGRPPDRETTVYQGGHAPRIEYVWEFGTGEGGHIEGHVSYGADRVAVVTGWLSGGF